MTAATLGQRSLRIKAAMMASLALLSCKRRSLGGGYGSGRSVSRRSTLPQNAFTLKSGVYKARPTAMIATCTP
ncbi:hypothetical protein N657DRAFT_244242 [Parathielavia appendiculata]|uniref:Uncharacterized protein n=1 Tax=Parathielavia appendiculata TaxID=2587402 RepID=A0AAN6Z0X4_9PEZI|nr:hypothetical protein N657DRAFT_244242 [Parathielavia appendiculata]